MARTTSLAAAGAATSLLAGLGRVMASLVGPLQTGLAVSVVVTGAASLVVIATHEGRERSPNALAPVALEGRIASEWEDTFEIGDQPEQLVAALKRGAEVAARQFDLGGGRIVDVSILRADGLAPCQKLETMDGRTPVAWQQSVCPARITMIDSHGRGRRIQTTACLAPASITTTGTLAHFDPQTGTVTLETSIDGHTAEPACTRTIHLPPLND